MTSVEEWRLESDRGPRSDTHLNTSSRLRFPLSDCLRPFSSRKHGEYRLSNLVPPECEACITPATNGPHIIACCYPHNKNSNTNLYYIYIYYASLYPFWQPFKHLQVNICWWCYSIELNIPILLIKILKWSVTGLAVISLTWFYILYLLCKICLFTYYEVLCFFQR